MPATSPIDEQSWRRQVAQNLEKFGTLLLGGRPRLPYDEKTVYGAAPNAQGTGFSWITSNYAPGNTVLSFAANPLRRILIIENLTTTPIAVSFGQTASVANNQGHILTTKGSVLYIDINTPTNQFYVDANGSSFAVTQGTPASQ